MSRQYSQPTPRVRHAKAGDQIRLTRDRRAFTINMVDSQYAYLTHAGGQMIVSRCHPIDIAPLSMSQWLQELYE